MWENMTYENILNDMLSRVTSNVDKREGSIIYDALAPAAYKLAESYFMLNNFINLVSGDTAVGEYLDRVVADYGIKRKPGTYAIRQIETSGEIAIGTRWGINDTTYVITELKSEHTYQAQCEQLGSIGNQYSGQLENIDNVSGITAALTDIITLGQDTESDDNLRARLYAHLQRPSTSGNVFNYREWALEVGGVGDTKVFPLWDGPGSVKLVIVDSDKQPATEALVAEVYEHIESVRPIGADVTVTSGTARIINITAKVALAPGYTLQATIDSFKEAVSNYFKSIAFILNYVSHAKVGTILLSTDGVIDYSDLKLNGISANVLLKDEEIPVPGSVDMEV